MKFMLMNFYRIKKRKGKKTSSLTDQGKGIRAESFKNGQDDVMWSELGLSCVFYWWWFWHSAVDVTSTEKLETYKTKFSTMNLGFISVISISLTYAFKIPEVIKSQWQDNRETIRPVRQTLQPERLPQRSKVTHRAVFIRWSEVALQMAKVSVGEQATWGLSPLVHSVWKGEIRSSKML